MHYCQLSEWAPEVLLRVRVASDPAVGGKHAGGAPRSGCTPSAVGSYMNKGGGGGTVGKAHSASSRAFRPLTMRSSRHTILCSQQRQMFSGFVLCLQSHLLCNDTFLPQPRLSGTAHVPLCVPCLPAYRTLRGTRRAHSHVAPRRCSPSFVVSGVRKCQQEWFKKVSAVFTA